MTVRSTVAIGSTTVEIRAGGTRWRKTARLNHQYLRREMRDAEDERKRVYPKTWETQIQRTVPLLWRMVREIATLYLRAPARSFEGATSAELATIEAAYRAAKVNRRLRTAQEHLAATGNATVWVWLTSTGYRLLVPPIHDQWAFSGRIDGQEVDDVEEWRLRVPIVTDPFAAYAPTAMALITKTRAVWESGPKGFVGQGIWAKDGSNPFGRIPVVILRASDPAPGEFFAPCPEDLLDAQRAVNHDFTSMGDWARKQGYSQAVAKGLTQTQANEIEVGPESVVGIPADASFTFESPGPDLAGAGGQLDAFIKLVIACSGMSPATVMKSTGITALAKIVENIDREVERQRAKDEFECGEQDLYGLMAQASKIRSGGLAVLPENVVVRVKHREPVMPADPTNDAQAKKQRIDMAIDCAATIIAAEQAISVDEGQKLALEHLRLQQELDAARGTKPQAPAAAPADTADPGPSAVPEPADVSADAEVV